MPSAVRSLATWLQKQVCGQHMPRLGGDYFTTRASSMNLRTSKVIPDHVAHDDASQCSQKNARAQSYTFDHLDSILLQQIYGHTCSFHLFSSISSALHGKNIGVEVLVVAFRVCIWAAIAAWCLWVGTYDCKSSAFIPASIPAAIFCFCIEPSWLNGATLSLIEHGRIQRYSVLLRATTPVCFLTALIKVEWYAKMMPAWMPKLWLKGGDTLHFKGACLGHDAVRLEYLPVIPQSGSRLVGLSQLVVVCCGHIGRQVPEITERPLVSFVCGAFSIGVMEPERKLTSSFPSWKSPMFRCQNGSHLSKCWADTILSDDFTMHTDKHNEYTQ